MEAAANAHDLEALLACFHDDHTAERPTHRGVRYGLEGVRQTWGALFREVADLRVEVLGWAVSGADAPAGGVQTVWAEWRWTGIHQDGDPVELQGVVVTGVRDDLFAWGRVYMEPVVLARALAEEL
jgi:ketosteroid isomerase-like protein